MKQRKQLHPPSWITKEVTSDNRYKNGSLARYGIPKD